jgi:hypothetical protein
MSLKLGIVSHENFRTTVLNALKDMTNCELEIYPRWYSHEKESVACTQDLNHLVDIILYSGPVPYYLSKKHAPLVVPADYVSHDEVSLMKAFFELQKQGVDLTALSIDTLPENTLKNVCEEFRLSGERMIIKPLFESNLYDDFTAFHVDNYRSGRTTYALTCRSMVYDRLREIGIPCYLMLGTKTSVFHALERLISTYQRSKYQGSQIAIGLIKIKLPSLDQSPLLHSRRYQIEIHQRLLNFAEQLKAGLTELGEEMYLFYTTYGVLKQVTKDFTVVPPANLPGDMELNMGIGTGDTTSIAEEGARKALMKAEKKGGDCAFIMMDNREMIGPFGRIAGKYIVRTESPQLLSLAQELGVTPPVLARLLQLVKEEQRTNFTAEELSYEIGLSARSARRILSRLQQKRLAEPIGNETSADRGRPKTIYHIKLATLPLSE